MKKKKHKKIVTKKALYATAGITTTGVVAASVSIPLFKNISNRNDDRKENTRNGDRKENTMDMKKNIVMEDPRNNYTLLKNENFSSSEQLKKEIDIIGSNFPIEIANDVLQQENIETKEIKTIEKLINKEDKNKLLYIFEIESKNIIDKESSKKAYVYFDLKNLNFLKFQELTFNKEKLVIDNKEVKFNNSSLTSSNQKKINLKKELIIKSKAQFLKDKLEKSNNLEEVLILPNNLDKIFPNDLNSNQIKFKKNNFLNFILSKKENDNSKLDSQAKFELTIKDKIFKKDIFKFDIIINGLKSKSKDEFHSIDKNTLNKFLEKSEKHDRKEVAAENIIDTLPTIYIIKKENSNTNITFEFEPRVGLIKWKAFLREDNHGYLKELNGSLEGYKVPKYSPKQIKEAQSALKDIAQNISKPELKDNINIEETISSQVKIDDFKNIWIKNTSFSAKVVNLKVDSNNNKKLIIDIKIEAINFPEKDVKPLTKSFIIEGFTTQKELDEKNSLEEKKRLEGELLNIQAIFNAKKEDFLLIKNESLISNLLEVSNISGAKKTFDYNIINNGETLKVKVKYTSLKLPDINVEKTLFIKGFLNDEKELYNKFLDKYYYFLIKDNLNNFKLKSGESKNRKLLSRLSFDDFVLLKKDNYSDYSDLTLNFLSNDETDLIKPKNDDTTGFLHWTLKSKKYNLQKKGTTKLENFASLTSIENNIFNNISKNNIENEINKKIKVLNKSEESVNNINNPGTFTSSFGDIGLNVEIDVTEWLQDKSKGEILWNANVKRNNSENSITKTFSGTLTGFKKEPENNVEKSEKKLINDELDTALKHFKKASEDFKNLPDQSIKLNNDQKNDFKLVNIGDTEENYRPFGIPVLPDFFKKEKKLIDYKDKVNSVEEWEKQDSSVLTTNYSKILKYTNQNTNLNDEFKFKIDYNSARINSDDTTQLLIDINFWSQKYPNLRRKYTVTYTGFSSWEIKNEDVLASFNKNLMTKLTSYGWSLGVSSPYVIFTSMLNSTYENKYQIFYDELISDDFKTKISWGQLDEFLNIIKRIKNADIFKKLKKEIDNWKTKIISNEYKYSISKEDPWKNIDTLISIFMSKIFSQDDRKSLFSPKEQNLLRFGVSKLGEIAYSWYVENDGVIKAEFSDTSSTRSSQQTLLTSNKYWKDLLGTKITLNNFWTNFKSLTNEISFIEMNKDKTLKAEVSYRDVKYGFDSIKFKIDLSEKRYFMSDSEKIQIIKKKIESDDKPVTILTLKNNIFKTRISVSKLKLSDIDLLLDNIDNKNLNFKLIKVSQNTENETIADISIRISSKLFPNIFTDVISKIKGFATIEEIKALKKKIENDKKALESVQITNIEIQNKINQLKKDNTFAEDVIMPKEDFTLDNDVIARFTFWKIINQSIEYGITLSKGSAIRKINGQISGFKSIQNADDNMGQIDVKKDKNITNEIWKLYYQTNVNPTKYNHLEKNQKDIIQHILESQYVLQAGKNTKANQLKNIIKYDEIYIKNIIFNELSDHHSLGVDLTVKSKLKPNFEQKISFTFKNLSNSFEQIRNEVSEIKIDAKGVDLTTYSSIRSLYLNTILSNYNNGIIMNIMLNNLKKDDGSINEEALAKYILRVLKIKLLYTRNDNDNDFKENFLYKEFIKKLFQEFKGDNDQNDKFHTLKSLTESPKDTTNNLIQKYNQTEIFIDLKELVTKIVGNIIVDDDEKQKIISSFLEKISFKISSTSQDYEFSIYLEQDNLEQDKETRLFIGSINGPENENSINYIKINFNEFIEKLNLKPWSKNSYGSLIKNKPESKIFKLKSPIFKEFFRDIILSGIGNRANISSVKGLNIFGDSIIDIFQENDSQIFRFGRGTDNKWGAGDAYSKTDSFKRILKTNLTFANADDVNDIYSDLNPQSTY